MPPESARGRGREDSRSHPVTHLQASSQLHASLSYLKPQLLPAICLLSKRKEIQPKTCSRGGPGGKALSGSHPSPQALHARDKEAAGSGLETTGESLHAPPPVHNQYSKNLSHFFVLPRHQSGIPGPEANMTVMRLSS